MLARVRPWLPLVVLGALVIGVAFVAGGGGRGSGPPLDPANPKAAGTKGLVEVLRELGADVDVTGAPADDADTALLLADDLTPARRAQLRGWVDRGGTLLLADPGSPLNPYDVRDSTEVGLGLSATIDRRCSLPALGDARRVDAPGAAVLGRRGGATGCFPRNGGHWLVAAAMGEGELVVVGGPGPFVNGNLDDADNVVVAAAVLSPRPGTRVAFLRPPPPGAGTKSLADLVSDRWWDALWQLGIAFALLALWRARRLGRPVLERQPVQLEGSELVVAVGDLLQRAGGRGAAADRLRDDARRRVADRLGLPPSAPLDAIAGAVASRTGRPTADVAALLAGPPPATEAELAELARSLESLTLEVARDQLARQ